MGYEAKVITDSLGPTEHRLITITATYPRFIHSEVMTHRDRARNAASSRAIPWPAMMERIQNDPVVPILFGSEKKGMQTGGEVDEPKRCEEIWLAARDSALFYANRLSLLGVHKSIVNRITEPWMWITVVMTATEWNNFFRLRCHPDAEIHFQKIASMIREAIDGSTPKRIKAGEWHLPFSVPEDFVHPIEDVVKACVARCARVSYLTHEGNANFGKDLELFDKLANGSGFGHWSPHEHVAVADESPVRSGPFVGFRQYRKSFALENVTG